jgi:hypothetical protein
MLNPCGSELARDGGLSDTNMQTDTRHREQARSHKEALVGLGSNFLIVMPHNSA